MKELNSDFPISISNSTLKSFDLKCEKCKLFQNFSLYNYNDLKLNLICNNGHSNNLNLDDYIKKIKNTNDIKECSNCNITDKINYCQFCNKSFCEQCNLNHFTIEHIFFFFFLIYFSI